MMISTFLHIRLDLLTHAMLRKTLPPSTWKGKFFKSSSLNDVTTDDDEDAKTHLNACALHTSWRKSFRSFDLENEIKF